MNDLQELLTCEWCKDTLRGTPLILSCCNATVCEHHVSVEMNGTTNGSNGNSSKKRKLFTCELCETSHQMEMTKRFAPNKTVAKLLEMQIGKLKFGEGHELAQSGCQFLKEKIDKTSAFLHSTNAYLSDYVAKLKRDVEMRRDELKRELDKIYNDLCHKLDAFESECKQNLITNHVLQDNLKRLQQDNEETLKNLDEWRKDLNKLVIDELKWTKIHSKTFFLESQLNGRVDELKDDLRMNKFWYHKKNTKFIREFGKELKSFERSNTIEFELQNFAKTFTKLERNSEVVFSRNYKFSDLEFCLGVQSKQSDDDEAYYLNLNLICESNRSSKLMPLEAIIKCTILHRDDASKSFTHVRKERFCTVCSLNNKVEWMTSEFIKIDDILNVDNGLYDANNDLIALRIDFSVCE